MKYFILSFLVTFFLGICVFGFSYREENIVIEVNNPYGFNIQAEVKCDWNESIKDFSLKKSYLFQAFKKTKIIMPKEYLKCEIWPNLKLF